MGKKTKIFLKISPKWPFQKLVKKISLKTQPLAGPFFVYRIEKKRVFDKIKNW
jgi:hypothetical protein